MTKREKLLQLKEKLISLEKKPLTVEQEIAQMIGRIKETTPVKTLKSLERLSNEVDKFKVDFNLKPILEAIKELNQEITLTGQELRSELDFRIAQLPKIPDLTNSLLALKQEFDGKIKITENLKQDIQSFQIQLQTIVNNDLELSKEKEIEIDEKFKKLRKEINNRFANLGGGNANRAIYFNGVDRLTRYTDINWKAGSNVTFTIANNDTTKKVDVTIAATGGGGGGGIVRLIQSISADQTADATTGTDYVYLVSGTTTLTLPDATTNTNLYTIKNVGTGVVTIATTSSQTIDGNLTITMATQFTSVDLISDTANWSIT